MPELPEVETTRRGIEPYLLNHHFNKVIIRQPKLRWHIDLKLTKYLKQQIITEVSRRGKYLLVHNTAGTLIIHLGMSGRLRVLPEANPFGKHDHVDFELSNGHILRFTDPRRFGSILWTTEDPFSHPLLCKLGPEPLSYEFNAKYLKICANNRQIPIKIFIMDSQTVVGVGNIYANEALFKAGILPTRSANTLTSEEHSLLVKEIKQVLKKAIAQGGTTLRDYYSAEGTPGFFIQQLQVYGRKDQPCQICQTILKEIRLGQRSTIYCPHCQR